MDIKLSCSCGAVQGVAQNITAKTGNRIVCCCDDCQKFATHLENQSETKILDEFGGTEIFQTSQAQIKIESGQEHIRCARLTSKGLFRWYTDCCKTPIGNTMKGGMPFIGIFHNFMSLGDQREQALGPVRAFVQTQHAIGSPTYPNPAKKFPLGITLRIIRKMMIWKIKGMHKPSVFFNDKGEPVVKPIILNEQ